VPFNASLNPAGPFTVEFWARPNQSPNDFFCPLSSIDDTEYNGVGREGWVFYEASGNEWSFRAGGTNGYAAVLTGGTVQVQAWQFVAGVYDGANASLYVNGAMVAGPTTASGFFPNTNTLFTLRMGGTSFGNRTFDGAVDEVAVFTNALSAATIQAHYQAATTNNAHYGTQILAAHPAGYWHLDEPAYAAVPVSSLPSAVNFGSLGAAANGTYFPGTAPGVTGVPGTGFGSPNTACAFSASSYIDVPGEALSFTGAVTISAWVLCPAATGQTESVASLGAGSYELTLDGQGFPHFVDGSEAFGTLAGADPVTDGKWHQLAGVYDGSSTESLYVDGQLAASNAGATSPPVVTWNDLFIGADPDAGAFQYFYGTIDEVTVWPQALTPSDVLWIYSAGQNVPLLATIVNSAQRGTVSLNWPTVPGLMYALESSTNLNNPNWVFLDSPFTATNSTSTISETVTGGQMYFWILVQP